MMLNFSIYILMIFFNTKALFLAKIWNDQNVYSGY